MPSGLPWSKEFSAQIGDKEDRDEYVADQVRVLIALSIRALREQRGLSQTAFGRLIGKPQSVVSRLEDPDYGKVSVQTLLEVGAALDIPLMISYPEWEDWFRQMRRLKKTDLERRPFAGAEQADQAANDASILQFSAVARDSAISTTVTGNREGATMKVSAYA